MSETKTPRMDKIIYRLRTEYELQDAHAELLGAVASMDLAAIEVRHAEEIRRVRAAEMTEAARSCLWLVEVFFAGNISKETLLTKLREKAGKL